MAKYLTNSNDITIEEVTGTDSIKFNTKYSMDSLKNGIDNMCVNSESTSTTNAYSADYINDCNTYSTNETFTGKYWIDGKKIYRKIYETTLPNCSTNGTSVIKNIDVSDCNIGILTNLQYTVVASGYQHCIQFYGGDVANNGIRMFYSTDGNLTIRNALSSANGLTTYITIEYTKAS